MTEPSPVSESATVEQPPVPLHKRRGVMVVIVICAVLAAIVAAIFWPQTKALIIWGWNLLVMLRDLVRDAGPGWFFAAFTLLPAFGSPLSLFTLTVAPTFAEQMGLGWVIVCSALCLIANLALSYWLSRYALRPLIEKVVRKLGYKLPHVAPEEHAMLCLLLRVVPGPPYVVQSYILGLVKVRFLPYMVISFLGQFAWMLGFIFFGDALTKGSGKTAIFAVTLIIALGVATRIVSKRLTKKVTVQEARPAGGA